MEKLIDALLNAMDENSFMLEHEKKKFKEVCRVIRQLAKVNESIENKVDLEPYMVERGEHANQLAKYKIEQRKLNRMYKILTEDKEVSEE